jgi:hypothetical protein
VICDDGNACTDDSCDTLLGCQFTNDDTNACSDGSLCTTDACVGGTCIGTPTVFCDDLNQCTVDACNPASGLCEYAPTPGLSCDDGDACTTSDRCAAASGPNLTQSFDAETPPGLPAGWTTQLITGLTGDIAWETTASFFDSAPNSVYTNDPTHVTDKVLVSPPFTGLGGAQVSFRNRYDLENSSGTPTLAYDGGVLEIRIGAGAWQDIIAAGGAWVSGGYNAAVSSSFGNPLAGRAAWSGASAGGFITTAVTMPAAADGETVQLRWRVGTDTSAGKNGQWIDDVVIPTGVPACVGTPLPPPAEVNRTVAVSNVGTLATISWTDPPGPFNVYRGATTGSWSYNQTCFDPNTAGPSTDPAVPNPGESYYYLVSRRDACGESVLGRDSSGTADPNPSPCP